MSARVMQRGCMRLRARASHILRSMGRSLLAVETANQELNKQLKIAIAGRLEAEVKLATVECDRAIELDRMLDCMNRTLAANFHRQF